MSAFESCLKHELVLLDEFVGMLQAEQRALASGAADLLAGIGEQKVAHLEKMNRAANTRQSVLSAAGCLASDTQGIADWATQTEGPQVRQLWETLIARATEARQLHEANGGLIAARLQTTNEILEVLSQQARYTNLYGADGQASQITGKRIIDAA